MPTLDFHSQLAICFIGIIWGLHLMTRSQDYKRVKERFERARDEYQADKYEGRERAFRILGFLLTAVSIYYFYDVLTRFTDFQI